MTRAEEVWRVVIELSSTGRDLMNQRRFRTHTTARTVTPPPFSLSYLSYLVDTHPLPAQVSTGLALSLSLSFLVTSCSHPWPVPRLGFTYLGHSSSTMSLCRYFRQRACLDWTNPRAARLPPTKMGAKAVSPRNPTTNTRGPAQ